ncbi:MAG: thiolase family protein [Flavobacteriales bacterium]|nr:thiolase family protein [Flavobacteriales bacterium]
MSAYIIKGLRSAVTKSKKGGFRFTSPVDFGAEVINQLLASIPQLDPGRVDDLMVGNAVPEAEQGLQMARWLGVRSNLPISVPGVTVNRYCGSGIETIAMATAKIEAGMADCIIAGGVESMSLVPTVGYKTVPNYSIATEHSDYFIGMGLTAEEVSIKYGINREEQDEFSLNSHLKAIEAIKNGKFKSEIAPITIDEVYYDAGKRKKRSFTVEVDEGPRPDTSAEGLSKLKPAFKLGGLVTAGNSSQTSDGAAFVIIMSEKMMKELGLEPEARLVSCGSAGVNPRYMGIGPCEAVPKVLQRTGMKIQDMDLIELNEAFAAQSLAVIKNLDLDPSKVNPNGGAIALGHPLGCTGARLAITLSRELKERNKKYGLVTACIGGGQGIAAVIERF